MSFVDKEGNIFLHNYGKGTILGWVVVSCFCSSVDK